MKKKDHDEINVNKVDDTEEKAEDDKEEEGKVKDDFEEEQENFDDDDDVDDEDSNGNSTQILKVDPQSNLKCCCMILHTDPNELVDSLRFYINSNHSLQSPECQAIIRILRQRGIIF